MTNTLKIVFPGSAIKEYVEAHGGFAEFLDNRGLDEAERSRAWAEYVRAIRLNLGVAWADRFAVDFLGVHPGQVWSNWFDMPVGIPDYGAIEDELMLGRFDSRQEFWTYIEGVTGLSFDSKSNRRTRFQKGLMPEAREYLMSMPINQSDVVDYKEEGKAA